MPGDLVCPRIHFAFHYCGKPKTENDQRVEGVLWMKKLKLKATDAHSGRWWSKAVTKDVIVNSITELAQPIINQPLLQILDNEQRTVRRINAYWMRRYRKPDQQSESDQEAQNLFSKDAVLRAMNQKRTSLNESIFRRQDNPTLIFVLTLLFSMAGLSQFITSLVYETTLDSPTNSEHSRALCAFLFAWDSMSFQAARLVGLIVLGLNLMSLGVKWAEALIFWSLIAIITAMIIVTNALGIGTPLYLNLLNMTSDLPAGKVIAVCHRKHNLASSLVLSFIAIGLETYYILSFLNIIAPRSFPTKRRLNTLFKDIRIVRAFSLLVFDVISIVPNAINTNSLGDALPLSIATLIVLAVFNNYHPSLPLFHEVLPRASGNDGQEGQDREQAMQYRALVVPRHPYSRAALSRSSSQFKSSSTEEQNQFTTTSRSDRALLGTGLRSETYNMLSKGSNVTVEAKALPPIPQEKQRHVHYARYRSSSRSKSRAGSRRTQRSNRSQKSALIRPIVPKAELARQFNDNERIPDPSSIRGLAPRPPGKTSIGSKSSPIQEPPPATVRSRSNGSETRRHSAATTAARTFTSVSIRYGSDILRPEPGRSVRDKMRVSPDTRAPSTTSERTRVSHHSQDLRPPVPVARLSRSSSHDSWLSDDIINAYMGASRIPPYPPLPSLPTFNGGWPLPPISVPTVNGKSDRRAGLRKPSRPGLPSTPAPAGSRKDSEVTSIAASTAADSTRKKSEDVEKIKSPTTARSDARRSRPPSVRGPRQQFPPPRSRLAQR
ncbi:hypothetical protein ACEPAF_6383 [Sanghuangporus sanghuang]